jgi:hypothetical protein
MEGRVGGQVCMYLDGGERRLVEALEVAAHLPLTQQLPPPLPHRRRPGVPRPSRSRASLEEERRSHGQRHQARPRRRHGDRAG